MKIALLTAVAALLSLAPVFPLFAADGAAAAPGPSLNLRKPLRIPMPATSFQDRDTPSAPEKPDVAAPHAAPPAGHDRCRPSHAACNV